MYKKAHLDLGASGEEAAVGYLKENGYKILLKNYRKKAGEIDIIARDKDAIVFIEVKTRRSDRYGLPSDAVSKDKQRRISRAAIIFLKENNLLDEKVRFDVVSVFSAPQKGRVVEVIKDAFEPDDFFTL